MATALIGMGSNINPEQHLVEAAAVIRKQFTAVHFSCVYNSQAVGMDGDDFLNACCLFQHDETPEMLVAWLKALENEHGRDRSHGSWKPRTLDLDILMFNHDVLDDDIYRYAHAFVPASELVQLKPLQDVLFAKLEKVSIKL